MSHKEIPDDVWMIGYIESRVANGDELRYGYPPQEVVNPTRTLHLEASVVQAFAHYGKPNKSVE